MATCCTRFSDSMVGVLNGHLEAVKQVKQSMDQGIEGIGGGAHGTR